MSDYDPGHQAERRERPERAPERRDLAPAGRLRRIVFDHRASVWTTMGRLVADTVSRLSPNGGRGPGTEGGA